MIERASLLRRIERAYLKAVLTRSDLIESGPFLISLNPANKLRWLNNALIVDNDRSISQQDIRNMVKVFEDHDRMPRMELFKEIWPDLIHRLIDEGFEIESELPAMVCVPESFTPRHNDAVTVE